MDSGLRGALGFQPVPIGSNRCYPVQVSIGDRWFPLVGFGVYSSDWGAARLDVREDVFLRGLRNVNPSGPRYSRVILKV